MKHKLAPKLKIGIAEPAEEITTQKAANDLSDILS
jgi:hypothetical protein